MQFENAENVSGPRQVLVRVKAVPGRESRSDVPQSGVLKQDPFTKDTRRLARTVVFIALFLVSFITVGVVAVFSSRDLDKSVDLSGQPVIADFDTVHAWLKGVPARLGGSPDSTDVAKPIAYQGQTFSYNGDVIPLEESIQVGRGSKGQ